MKNETNKDLEELGIRKYPTFLTLRVSAWIEIAIFFIITSLLAWWLHYPVSYNTVCPHPFWIIVILMAAQYGTGEALLAAIVATAFFLTGPYPVHTFYQNKYEYLFLLIKGPILWFVAALILGEVRNRQFRQMQRLIAAFLASKEKEKVITEAYGSLKKIKEELEIRYASQMQTATMACDAFKQLEKRDRPGIIKAGLDLVQKLISPDKASIFLLEQDALKMVASSGWKEKESYQQPIPSSSPLFSEIVVKQRPVTVVNPEDREVLHSEGALAVPMVDKESNTLFGMIKIEEIPFLRLRKGTIETCREIGEWIGGAYAGALSKEQALEQQFVSTTSGLLTPSFWQFQSHFLMQLCKRLKISLTRLQIALEGLSSFSEEKQMEMIKLFRDTVKETIRSIDQVFEYKKQEGEFFILLVNTDREKSEIVRKKILFALENKFNNLVKISCILIPLYEEKDNTATPI
jgi:polysaccharide biosynthesis protein PelD